MKNIEEIVNEDRNLTVLSRAIIAADLKKVLSRERPFTVFAPSNLAFSKLDVGVLQTWREDAIFSLHSYNFFYIFNTSVIIFKTFVLSI